METKQTCPYCGRILVKYPGKWPSVYMCPHIWCRQNDQLTVEERSWLQVYSGEEPMCLCKYFDQDFQMCILDNSSVRYPKCTRNCDQYQVKTVTRFEKMTKDPRTLAGMLVYEDKGVWHSYLSDFMQFDCWADALQWTTEQLEQEEPVIWKKPEEPKKEEPPMKTQASMFSPYDIIQCKVTGYMGVIKTVNEQENEVLVSVIDTGEELWIDPDDIELWRGDEPRKD